MGAARIAVFVVISCVSSALRAQEKTLKSLATSPSGSGASQIGGENATALCREARVLRFRGRMAEAEALGSRGLALAQGRGDTEGQAECGLALGETAYYRGDNERAEEWYRKALLFFEQAQDPLGQGNVWWRLGEIARIQGKNEEAEELYRKALGYFEQAQDPLGQGNVWSSLGDIAYMRGRNEEAEELYRKALGYFEQAQDPVGQGNVWMSLGDIAYMRGENKEAEDLYRKALLFFEQAQDPVGQGNVWRSLGDIAYMRGQNEEAEGLYRKALGFFEQAQDPVGQGNVWAGIARVRVREGKALEALDLYDKAIALYRAQEHRFNEMWTRYRKGRALEGLGRIEEALKEYEEACGLADFLVENVGGGEEQRVEFRGELFEIYEAPIRLHYERKKGFEGRKEWEAAGEEMVAAFRLMERARAQALLRRLRELGVDLAARVLPEGLRKEEEERLQGIADLRVRVARKRGDQTLRAELGRLEEEQKRFEDALWDHPEYVAYAAVRYPRPVDPSRLALGPEEVLVEFFVGESGVYRFVVYRGRVEEFERVEGEVGDLEREVTRLRADIQRVLEDRMFVFQSRASRTLYERLMKGAVERVPTGGRLVVVPDGFLWALPFEVLDRAEEGEGPRYLGLEVPVVRAPSARSMEWLRRQGRGMMVPDREVLAVGDPVYRPEEDARCQGGGGETCDEPKGAQLRAVQKACARVVGRGVGKKRPVASRGAGGEGLRGIALRAGILERLCASREEVRRVVEGFDPGKRDVLLDLDATKARVLDLLAQHTYRVVHFSTHGLLPEDRQCGEGEGGRTECLDQPALVLAATGGGFRDQMLAASEVFGSRVPAQVVTLSACRTGEGRVVRGEGVVGMGQAFLYAGARSVVMSLWPVSDSSAKQWMTTFYAAMQAGKDLAQAAMEARREVARGGPDGKNGHWSHPFFWSPFVLMGLTK